MPAAQPNTPADAPLVWFHCAQSDQEPVIRSLIRHMAAEDLDFRVLLTGASEAMSDVGLDCHRAEMPADTANAVRGFLDQWRPAGMIWFCGPLKSALCAGIGAAQIPALLVNARYQDIVPRGLAWQGRQARTVLSGFRRIFVCDGSSGARLQKIGIAPERIEISGPILELATAPPHDPNEFTVMAEAVGSRPCWFAAHAVPGEINEIANAHKTASRRGHRLLTLISPRVPDHGPEFADRLRQKGFRVGVRSQGDAPMEDAQAYIADIPGEEGLWFRLAPLSFMGGTLSGPDGLSPFDPASVGSAVLHGPFTQSHADQYDRLARAGAARRIRSGAELGVALGELIGPERCAAMAHAGWQEVTQSADLITRLVDLVEQVALEGEIT